MGIKESTLGIVQELSLKDSLRIVTESGASKRLLVPDLAKTVIEDYGGSFAGGAESVKDAINSINDSILALLDAVQNLQESVGAIKVMVKSKVSSVSVRPGFNNGSIPLDVVDGYTPIGIIRWRCLDNDTSVASANITGTDTKSIGWTVWDHSSGSSAATAQLVFYVLYVSDSLLDG